MPRRKKKKNYFNDYSHIDRKYFDCDNCGIEQKKYYKIQCKYCNCTLCETCYFDYKHGELCRKRHCVQFIIDRWRYVWYNKLDKDGLSNFCKMSVKDLKEASQV